MKSKIIVISEEPDAILQTIQSRTQRFNIHGIKEPEISKVLQTKYGLQPEDADDIAHRSEGNFLKALETIHLSEENKLFFELFINLMRLSYQRKIRTFLCGNQPGCTDCIRSVRRTGRLAGEQRRQGQYQPG